MKNLFDNHVQSATSNLSDTSLTLSMTLSVILRERSDALHTLLSFRTQYPVILNEVKNLRGHDGGSLHKDYKGRVAQTAETAVCKKCNARPFTKFN